MTHLLEIETGRLGYAEVVRYVVKNGERVCPRGLATLDAGWVTIVIRDPSDSLPLGVGRSVSRRIAAAEAVQLVGEFSHPPLLTAASERFRDFLEPDSARFHGAYGERVRGQLAAVVRKLTSDPHSRQAVVTLWDPWLDNQPDKRDYPCTVALHLRLVGGRLELNVTMRSNDVWLGLPFDLFQFSQLQLTLARVLGAEAGTYRHTACSLHIYEVDLPLVDQLHDPVDVADARRPRGVGRPGDGIYEVIRRARALVVQDHDPGVLDDITESEVWYRDYLRARNAAA